MTTSHRTHDRATTAVLLAAGMGSRLHPDTDARPKCLTPVSGIPILERLLSSLDLHGFTRLIIVTGHLDHHIRHFLAASGTNVAIDYVVNPLYRTTNNIYSLWLARELITESFVLIESDVVFDPFLLGDLLRTDCAAVAELQPWMSGACVTLADDRTVKDFTTSHMAPSGVRRYKTVNVYGLSLASWRRIAARLDAWVGDGKVASYYEAVFAEMVAEGSLSLVAVPWDGRPWYEIDTPDDLAQAESLFPSASALALTVGARPDTGAGLRRRASIPGSPIAGPDVEGPGRGHSPDEIAELSNAGA